MSTSFLYERYDQSNADGEGARLNLTEFMIS